MYEEVVSETSGAFPLTGNETTKLSARNQIAGTITSVHPGATRSHITTAVSPTVTITASITNEATAELGLKVGMQATAVIKASDVMVSV